jgi:predicted TPR repeat methyltransferase
MAIHDERFESARAAFVEGVDLYESGRYAEAERRLEAALALLPGRVSTLINLGATRLALARPADAIAVLDQALAAEPAHAEAWCHRGLACIALARDTEALDSFDRALTLDPTPPAAHFHRARVLGRLGRGDAALAAYERALELDAGFGPAWSELGQLRRDLGRIEPAREAFRRAIACGADVETNRYFLAALDGHDAPPATPQAYVRALFDSYADDFEPHLLQVLRYCAHEVVVQTAAQARTSYRSALDLGCGTGLCGPLLQPLAARVEGVDLSPTMLAAARQRGVYAELVQADLAAHLQATPRRHDLIVAADVFIYVGDLAGVRRVLEPEGVFAFSVEAADERDGFVLRPSLRYAHSARYLRTLAAAHGLEVLDVREATLREEQREPVRGLVVRLG